MELRSENVVQEVGVVSVIEEGVACVNSSLYLSDQSDSS